MRVVEYSRKDCCVVDSILYFSCSPLSVMDEFSLHFVSLPTQNKTLHLVVVIVCSDSHSNDDGDRHCILYILLKIDANVPRRVRVDKKTASTKFQRLFVPSSISAGVRETTA